jgi:hypothetical protein
MEQNFSVQSATLLHGTSMKPTRRVLTLSGTAIALAATFSSLPARADDASDAKAVVDKAAVTVATFAKDPDHASMHTLMAKA